MPGLPGHGDAGRRDLTPGQLLGGSLPIESDVEPDLLRSANGDLIINYAGTATDWPTSLSAWEGYACQVAGRGLSRAEWASVLPDRPYEAVCPTRTGRSP